MHALDPIHAPNPSAAAPFTKAENTGTDGGRKTGVQAANEGWAVRSARIILNARCFLDMNPPRGTIQYQLGCEKRAPCSMSTKSLFVFLNPSLFRFTAPDLGGGSHAGGVAADD
jgi:hypothetical protein